jgi:hypothetical protein
MIKIRAGIEAVKKTLMTDVAVIIDPTRQSGTVVVPKLEIDGIGAVQNYGGIEVGLDTEGKTGVNEAARGLNVTALLEATRDGEYQAGHGLDLSNAREAVRESNPIAGTVVGTVAGTVENAHARMHVPTGGTGAVPVLLDDIVVDQEIVVAVLVLVLVLQILTTLLGRTHAHLVAAAVIDLAIETRIEIGKRTAKTGTEKEIALSTDGAGRDLALAQQLCHTQLPRTS